jgi:hypothetical protein
MIINCFFVSLISLFSFSYLEDDKIDFYVASSLCVELPEIVVDSTSSGLNFQLKDSYRNEKQNIVKHKLELKKSYLLLKDSLKKEEFLDSASIVFTELLLNNVIPHWYGTPWDFNGYTNVPNKGEVACGYFVSTTLCHMGLNLNRYHLARQGPLNEGKSLAIDTNLALTFNSENLAIKNEFFSSFTEGLYFVGLDSHVGYLYVYDNHAFFLHSNYMENRVMLEPISLSEAFSSSSYTLVKITGNLLLIKKWLLDDQFHIYKK